MQTVQPRPLSENVYVVTQFALHILCISRPCLCASIGPFPLCRGLFLLCCADFTRLCRGVIVLWLVSTVLFKFCVVHYWVTCYTRVVSEISPIPLNRALFLRGQPFVVVSETMVDVIECTHSVPQWMLNS